MPKRKRCKQLRTRTGLPKGAFPLPSGGYGTRRVWVENGRQWTLEVHHKANPDLQAYAKALVQIALDEVAAELADTEHGSHLAGRDRPAA